MTSPRNQPTRRTSYGRFLLVARLLYLPGLVLVGLTGLTVLGLVIAGARHASEGAISQAFGIVTAYSVAAAGLPLLLFIPDRGPGTFVRWLHGLGALCLAVAFGASGNFMWKAAGEEIFKRWQVKSRLANLTLIHASADPIRLGETLIGIRLNVEFDLAREVVLDQVGVPVIQAMRNLNVNATDPGQHNMPFSYYRGVVTVTHNGQPVGGERLAAGRYRATRVEWLAGLRVLESEETPCKEASELEQGYRRDAVIAAGKSQWIVTARQVQGDMGGSLFFGSRSVLWEARSAPLDLHIDGSAWLAGFDALPLPSCEARKTELETARQRERIEAFHENRLSTYDAERMLHSILCADDTGPLRELVARGIPYRPIYIAAMRCVHDKRRPEIIEILGPRLVMHPEDAAEHCASLTAIHSSLDVERLRTFARAGVPINCETKQGDAWRNGLQTRSLGRTSPEEIAREVEWIRLLIEQEVPVCIPPPAGWSVLQHAVRVGSVESLAAWLEAGCDPGARADPATSDKFGWQYYSPRLLWLLRYHYHLVGNRSVREWPQLSADDTLNAHVTRRMGLPTAQELNAPFTKRGGVVPLHDFVVEALASPRLLRVLADQGARLDAASDSPAQLLGFENFYTIEPRSWFVPGYSPNGIPNIHYQAALDVLTTQELRTLIAPVNLTTGRPHAAMPQASNFESASSFGNYLCKRKIQACPNAAQ